MKTWVLLRKRAWVFGGYTIEYSSVYFRHCDDAKGCPPALNPVNKFKC